MGLSCTKIGFRPSKSNIPKDLVVSPCFHPNGTPSETLLRLLELTEQDHHNTLESIVEATQNRDTGWLRVGERWHEQEERYSLKARNKIKQLARQLGYLEEILPKKTHYHRVAVLGATSTALIQRFNFLVKLHQAGVKFDKLVFLGSSRNLTEPATDANLIEKMVEAGFELDEAGLMRYFWERMIEIPVDLREKEVEFIRADGQDGYRANTQDTIKEWMRSDANLEDSEFTEEACILFISSQPYASYQGKVAEMCLKENLTAGN